MSAHSQNRSSAQTIRGRLVGWLASLGITILVLVGLTAAAFDASKLPPPASKKVDFVKDIQPILALNCYSCHGEKKQEAELRWDAKTAALKGGEHGAVIIPGKSAESRVISLVAEVKEGEFMPKKGDRLTREQIGLLRAWIDQGAAWPDGVDTPKSIDKRDHWAFKAPVRPPEPTVKNKKWPRNAIDRFVLARLETEKLSPSPEADRITLIRRLSLDLTGLPPTINEVDYFMADRRPEAYEKLVERLLASPHYGERWGRHWLDAARYADTNGYEKDMPRNIWPYRDWVIDAFNRDLPFDQFTIDQIAGDLLPNATLEQRVATGFLRNSMLNEEGGVDPEQFRIEAMVDRMDTLGKSFLGLTINCCQCHNHKYDPITQREYYQMFAFLNNDDEPEIEVPSPEQRARRAEILARVKAIEAECIAKDPDLSKRLTEWQQQALKEAGNWTVLEMDKTFGAIGVKFEKLSDHSLLALAHNPGESVYSVTVKTELKGITAFRLEALTDPNLPRNGPGRSKNGNFVLQEFMVVAAPLEKPEATNIVILQNATADFSQPGFPVTNAIDGVMTNGWAIDAGPGRVNQERKAVFETKEPIGFDGGSLLTFHLVQKHGQALTLGRFRLSATTTPLPVRADPLPTSVRGIISKPKDARDTAEEHALMSYYISIDPNFSEARKQIDELMNGWPYGAPTLALAQRRENARTTAIFKRGDWRKPGEAVRPGVPAILNPLPKDDSPNRLTLAKWLVDRNNPLMARVIANRIWLAYFGQGLVSTPEDFGTRSDPASHPGLLDWLACEFMDNGWSTKAMHRIIVTSATYRQSSKVTPLLYGRDPYNRLLARGPRNRVDAEIVRDIALSASGLLSKKIGGASVYPPIPEGVLSLAYGGNKWETSAGEDRYRRGMYTFWKRTVPYPGMSIFDAPNADFSCVRRVNSNTPLQALTTLNDAVFQEAAQALALRVWQQGGLNDRERASYAFRLCTGRAPKPSELKPLLDLVQDQSTYFENRTAAAVQVSAPDVKNPPPNVNLHKVAAWSVVARVLLNLDETITKE